MRSDTDTRKYITAVVSYECSILNDICVCLTCIIGLAEAIDIYRCMKGSWIVNSKIIKHFLCNAFKPVSYCLGIRYIQSQLFELIVRAGACSEPVYADIVFVHGLLGGPFKTWRQKDSVYVARAKALEQLKQQQESEKQNDKNLGAKSDGQNVSEKTDDKVDTTTQCSPDQNAQLPNETQSEDKCTCDKNSKHQSDSKPEAEKRPLKQILRLNKFNIADIDINAIFGFKKAKEKPKKIKSKNWYTFCWPKVS